VPSTNKCMFEINNAFKNSYPSIELENIFDPKISFDGTLGKLVTIMTAHDSELDETFYRELQSHSEMMSEVTVTSKSHISFTRQSELVLNMEQNVHRVDGDTREYLMRSLAKEKHKLRLLGNEVSSGYNLKEDIKLIPKVEFAVKLFSKANSLGLYTPSDLYLSTEDMQLKWYGLAFHLGSVIENNRIDGNLSEEIVERYLNDLKSEILTETFLDLCCFVLDKSISIINREIKIESGTMHDIELFRVSPGSNLSDQDSFYCYEVREKRVFLEYKLD